MQTNSSLPGYTVLLLTLAALVVVLAGIKTAEAIVTPFLLALFVAAISAPGFFWLRHRNVPEALALLVVVLVIVALGFALSLMVGTSIDGFSRNIPFYQERLQQIAEQSGGLLQRLGVDTAVDYNALLNLSAVMGFVGKALNRLMGTLADGFFILLVVIFILLELDVMAAKIRQVADNPRAAMARVEEFSGTLNRYFHIKTLMSLLTAAVVVLALLILDVDYPMLWGVIAFLLNFIPNIGSVIAAVPAVLMALIQHGFISAGWVALVYVLVNNVVGNVLEPRFMGRSLGLSTLVVFLSLIFWGWLLGPVGMFLSVPLTMTIKIALQSSHETYWLSVLLGNEVGPGPATALKPAQPDQDQQ